LGGERIRDRRPERSRTVLYAVIKPNGEPYHWCDVREGWANYPILLRREDDAVNIAGFLEGKFGASRVKRLDAPNARKREKIPERMDSLDIQLGLWIVESKAGGQVS
jgi:hypothetical protein